MCSRAQHLRERREWRKADTAGDEPRFIGRCDGREWPSKWSEALDAIARLRIEQERRRRSDALAEAATGRRSSPSLFEQFEYRERAAKQRLEPIAGLHHHELSRQGALCDFGGGEAEHVVIGRQMDVRDDFGDDVQRHDRKYIAPGRS